MSAPAAGSRWDRFVGGSAAGLALAAVVVGLAAGLGAVVFREAVFGATRLFTGQEDYAATPGAPLPWLPQVGPWFLLALPVVGGLIYGPLVYRYAREARGHGVPEVMLAVSENDGRIRPQVALVKIVASALTIGSGGSVGREGPIVQIGSAVGSSLGQWMRMPTARLRLLVACGAGGGISATFDAPVAGVFFALEIILLDFTVPSFVAVATSAAVANVVAALFEGSGTFLRLPPFTVVSLHEYWFFAVVGVVGGVVGVAFTRVLYGLEDLADRVYPGPEWARPAIGGVLLGLVLVALPQLYGVGYPVLATGVTGGYVVGFLLLLLVGKMLATSLTLAIGGSGGIFAPSLFLGAMAGSALGDGFAALAPGVAGAPGAYGLVGMAAVLAGATRAPITAVVIVAEITAEWALTVPLMIAVVLATAVSRLLSTETIYTMKISRRGIRLTPPAERDLPVWTRRTVGDAMRPTPGAHPFADPAAFADPDAVRSRGPLRWVPAIDAGRTLGAATADLAATPVLPVLSDDGRRVAGVLAAADVVGAAGGSGDGGGGGDPPARCLVRVDGAPARWEPHAAFTVVDAGPGPRGDGPVLLSGPVEDLDALAASLPESTDREAGADREDAP